MSVGLSAHVEQKTHSVSKSKERGRMYHGGRELPSEKGAYYGKIQKTRQNI
jgi:hypothetical protein